MTIRDNDIVRFWGKIQKTDGCWVWVASKTNDGYGHLWNGKTHLKAHRVSYYLAFGNIPDGLQVCHHCDNPSCVRPDHLFLGTNSDNQMDASRKGRHASKKKTHCPSGHEYSPGNTYLTSDKKRMCRTCHRERQAVLSTDPATKEYKKKWKQEHPDYAARQRAYALKRYYEKKKSSHTPANASPGETSSVSLLGDEEI